MIQVTVEANVEGLGEIGYVNAQWDQSLIALREKGAKKPISARDLAYARINSSRDSSLNTTGSYIQEGILFTPNEKGVLLVRNSPLLILKNARKATQAHRQGNEFYLDGKKYHEQTEQDATKEPHKRRVLKVAKAETFEIPTNRFGEDETTLWLFGDQAKEYGDFLGETIDEMPVELVGQEYTDKQKQPFANQLWLNWLDNRSELNGNIRDLNYDDRSRGVLSSTSGAGSHSAKEQSKPESTIKTYSLTQISDALNDLGFSGLEQSLFKKLKK